MKKGLLLVILVLMIVMTGSFFLGDRYTVQRSLVVKAPVGNLIERIGNLENQNLWDPWKGDDPILRFQYGKQRSGPGAGVTWVSPSSGKGSLRILESRGPGLITARLDMGEKGTALVSWKLVTVPGGVKVTLTYDGNAGPLPVDKYRALIMDLILGPPLERALQGLSTPGAKAVGP